MRFKLSYSYVVGFTSSKIPLQFGAFRATCLAKNSVDSMRITLFTTCADPRSKTRRSFSLKQPALAPISLADATLAGVQMLGFGVADDVIACA
jgi:hypothetical protein